MTSPHTRINLDDVEDAAPGNGFGDRWEARGARIALDAEQTGVTHFRLRPGKRSPFAHRHRNAERDAIRVAPSTARAFEAGPDGLEFLAFGPHHAGDGEPVDDAWVR